MTGRAAALSARIRAELETGIVSGAWPPGHKLPAETELAARHACSRMTVNKAMSDLAAAGLITRRRRAGSFVATPPGERTVMEIGDFASDAARRGQRYRFEILSRQIETRPDGAEALRIACRHLADDVPLAHEDRAILLSAVPDARGEQFAAAPPGTWLLRTNPWTEAEHAIAAAAADAAMAACLGIRAGAACLVLDRTTWHRGALVTAVRLTYPGDRHRFIGRFSPTGA